tara:strand:- start:416 stop:901 length:486 start_codon:yes stop_codon:yes gene_type:complete
MPVEPPPWQIGGPGFGLPPNGIAPPQQPSIPTSNAFEVLWYADQATDLSGGSPMVSQQELMGYANQLSGQLQMLDLFDQFSGALSSANVDLGSYSDFMNQASTFRTTYETRLDSANFLNNYFSGIAGDDNQMTFNDIVQVSQTDGNRFDLSVYDVYPDIVF